MTKTDGLWTAFGFALMAAYWPNISGVATTPRWDVAALLVIPLFFAPRVVMGPVHWIGLLLLAWLIESLDWSQSLDGIDIVLHMAIAVAAFAVGSHIASMRPLFIGATLGIGVSSAIAMVQRFGWSGIEQYSTCCAGLFYNRDRLAAAAALVAIGSIALRIPMRLWVPLLVPSLVLAGSRGAWLALIGGLWCLRPRWTFCEWPLRIIAMVAVAVVLVWRGYDPSAAERLAIIRDTITNLSLSGHGLGSFRDTFLSHAHFYDITIAQTRPEHPHNEWLWLAYEGGVPAFALALVFSAALWRSSQSALRAVLGGVLVLSQFAMPLQDPATLVLGALCAGHLAGDRARRVRETVDRRSALRAGMVGIAAQASLR